MADRESRAVGSSATVAASRPVHAELQSYTQAEAAQTFILLLLVNKLGSCASSATQCTVVERNKQQIFKRNKTEQNKTEDTTYSRTHTHTGKGREVCSFFPSASASASATTRNSPCFIFAAYKARAPPQRFDVSATGSISKKETDSDIRKKTMRVQQKQKDQQQRQVRATAAN